MNCRKFKLGNYYLQTQYHFFLNVSVYWVIFKNKIFFLQFITLSILMKNFHIEHLKFWFYFDNRYFLSWYIYDNNEWMNEWIPRGEKKPISWFFLINSKLHEWMNEFLSLYLFEQNKTKCSSNIYITLSVEVNQTGFHKN